MSKTGKKTKQNKKRRDCGDVSFIHILWVVLLFVLAAIFINKSQIEDAYLGSRAKEQKMTKKAKSKA